MSDADDDRECFITREDTEKALANLEKQLAERYHLKGDLLSIRGQIIVLHKYDVIEEDDLVRDWVAQYSCLLDWIDNP